MDANEIKNLIAQNKLKEAIDALRIAISDQDSDLHNQLLLLSSNYNHLVSEIIQGLRERDQQMNRIVHSLIQCVDMASEKGLLATPVAPATSPAGNPLVARFALASEEEAAILYHLIHTDYTWRNLDTLTKRTGLSPESIEAFVRKRPDLVVRSRAKSGNIIFKLTDDARKKAES